MLEGFVSLLVVPECGLHLSEQEPFARLLLRSHLVFDDFSEVGNGLGQPAAVQIVVGEGVVPLLHGAPVHGIAAHLGDDILGIVEPVVLDVAFGKPRPRLAVDGGLCLIEPCHVGKRGGSLVKVALVELRTAHQHPCFPQERVVLLAVEPLQVALRLLPALLPFGLFLDAVVLDGLLTLLDGALETAGAELARAFVSHGVERDHLRVVVLVALFLGQRAFDVGQRPIIIGIIARGERVPPARLRRVLLGGTGTESHGCHYEKDDEDGRTGRGQPAVSAPMRARQAPTTLEERFKGRHHCRLLIMCSHS